MSRFLSSKRGIELSVNMMVVLILTIVVFGFGIRLAFRLAQQGNDITDKTFDKLDQQIFEMSCASAQKVCLPAETKTTEGDKPLYFNLVVENIYGEQRSFTMAVTTGTFVDKTGQTGTFDPKLLFVPAQRQITLAGRKAQNFAIAVQSKGAAKGMYSFTVGITDDTTSQAYVSPLKFYVKV